MAFVVTFVIPDTESAKLMFSVILTFFLTNTKNRTKKSLT